MNSYALISIAVGCTIGIVLFLRSLKEKETITTPPGFLKELLIARQIHKMRTWQHVQNIERMIEEMILNSDDPDRVQRATRLFKQVQQTAAIKFSLYTEQENENLKKLTNDANFRYS